MATQRLSLRDSDSEDEARRDAVVEKLDGGSIELDEDVMRVSMGSPPIFSTEIPRSSIKAADRRPDLTGPTTGVHGFRGKWLVNRSSKGIVRLSIRPRATARLTLSAAHDVQAKGFSRILLQLILRDRSIKLRELTLSVEDPDALIEALRPHRP